ncbi:hypothetical protein [Paraburkholderia tagetis]|uniref:Uncharacterized protein n=1 Tax=Paraburkholderia tagetis TaxID=2913261 RepID=A0A9X1UMD1_9BURK|nr:hypothetical protein [Paraburkholderia tagetis]MCG5078040.1 hypothetical protein [Paraburkholderia tagetis]
MNVIQKNWAANLAAGWMLSVTDRAYPQGALPGRARILKPVGIAMVHAGREGTASTRHMAHEIRKGLAF